MITALYLGLAAYFGGFITGAMHTSNSKNEELKRCYNMLDRKYRELPRYGALDDSLALGEEGTCE